jgi:hypothetical protein
MPRRLRSLFIEGYSVQLASSLSAGSIPDAGTPLHFHSRLGWHPSKNWQSLTSPLKVREGQCTYISFMQNTPPPIFHASKYLITTEFRCRSAYYWECMIRESEDSVENTKHSRKFEAEVEPAQPQATHKKALPRRWCCLEACLFHSFSSTTSSTGT